MFKPTATGLSYRITKSNQINNAMDKWPNYIWYYLLSICLYVSLLTSCSSLNLPNIIPTSDSNQPQHNIRKTPTSNKDNQISLLDDKLRKKDKEVVELRSNLNNLNELKSKLKDRNNELSRLKNELDRITYSNNEQTNEITRLKNELEKPTNQNNSQTNEIARLKNELEQVTSSKQTQSNEITSLQNELNKTIYLNNSQTNEMIRLKNELDRITYSYNEQTNEITRLKNELEKPANTNNAQTNEIARLKKELEHVTSSKQAQINELKKTNTKLSKNIIVEKPSFNCKSAFKWDEKIICSNPILAKLDRKLSKTYKAALKSTHGNKAKNKLIDNQKSWLNIRHQCKKDNEKILCLNKEYIKQLVYLQDQHKSNKSLKIEAKAPPRKKRKQKIPRLPYLFQKLPFYNYSRYNRTTILDKNSNLLWTKLNFAQKERVFPENAIDCQQWAEQMIREKHGGVKNWRVPKHSEFRKLFELYSHVIGGKYENFVYWGLKDTSKNIGVFSFKNVKDSKVNMNNSNPNCRLVANLKKVN